jgi:hypothetical protein
MAIQRFSRFVEAVAELGSVAVFIVMVLMWADALPVI